MRVLVIGGAGYIGSHAVRKLIEEGNDVVVLDSLYTGHRKAVDKKAKFYQGDIEDTNLVSKILRDENIDAVMHFAAYSLVPESVKKPLKYYDNNVSGMISLLQAMDDAKVKYLVSHLLLQLMAFQRHCQLLKIHRLIQSIHTVKLR